MDILRVAAGLPAIEMEFTRYRHDTRAWKRSHVNARHHAQREVPTCVDWRSAEPFRALGRPRLFFGVSTGDLDSMLNHVGAAADEVGAAGLA
jgi:hypothetical protein